MTARGGWLWMAAALVTALFAFSQKHEARELKERLAVLEEELADRRENTRVLAAEWSYLSRPERISDLAQRHLEQLLPMSVKQFSSFADIPFRRLRSAPARPGAVLPVKPGRSRSCDHEPRNHTSAGPGRRRQAGRGDLQAAPDGDGDVYPCRLRGDRRPPCRRDEHTAAQGKPGGERLGRHRARRYR